MSTYAIWFEDVTQMPERLPGGIPARELATDWLPALLGQAKARQIRYLPNDCKIVTGILVDVPDHVDEQFCTVLRKSVERLGTIAWIRNYYEAPYQKAWDNHSPL